MDVCVCVGLIHGHTLMNKCSAVYPSHLLFVVHADVIQSRETPLGGRPPTIATDPNIPLLTETAISFTFKCIYVRSCVSMNYSLVHGNEFIYKSGRRDIKLIRLFYQANMHLCTLKATLNECA